MLDKEKLVSVIVGKMEKPEQDYDDKDCGFEQAAYEMMKAIKKDDALGLAHALRNFVEMCEQ